MGSSLVPSRVRGQPRRSRGFTTQRLPLTGPAPLSRHAADRAGKTMLFVFRPRTPGQIDLGAMMTCFVSRVRATRCGHPAGLSRRGPLCSVPRRTGWPRIEALVRWTIGKPTGHHPYPTMLQYFSCWMLVWARYARATSVRARSGRVASASRTGLWKVVDAGGHGSMVAGLGAAG